jgi:hypothetical protein
MRNTLMQDKLKALLVSPPPLLVSPSDPQLQRKTEVLIASAIKSARRPSKKKSISAVFKNPYQAIANVPEPHSSRYVTPPSKRNPFSVHVHPVSPELVENSEPSLPELKAEEPKIEEIEEPRIEEPKIEEVKAEPPIAVVPEALPQQAPVPEPVAEIPTIPETETPAETDAPKISLVATVTPIRPSEVSEISVLVPSEKAAEEHPSQEETPQSIAALPQNLKWLEQSTPFDTHLHSMVDQLRTAKTSVVFTLSQSTARQTELKDQIAVLKDKLDKEEFLGEQQREYLHQLDEVIAACALVAEQSSTVESILRVPDHVAHKHHEGGPKRQYHKAALDSPTVCHREDVLKVIKENPGRKWSNAEIVQALPAAKRSNAKQYVYALLSSFTKEGLIQRIAPGIYVCQSPKDAAEEA